MGRKKKKSEVELCYERDGKYYCPKCGTEMVATSGLMDYECPNCDEAGTKEYDPINKLYYIEFYNEYSFEEIFSDPENNKPFCCDACGGPYPNCLTSCKIFDD